MVPCPHCGGRRSKVISTRVDGPFVKRRRECLTRGCGKRYHTYELTERLSGTIATLRDRAAKLVKQRAELHRKHMEIVQHIRSGRSQKWVAIEYGMAASTIAWIVARHAPDLRRQKGRGTSAAKP